MMKLLVLQCWFMGLRYRDREGARWIIGNPGEVLAWQVMTVVSILSTLALGSTLEPGASVRLFLILLALAGTVVISFLATFHIPRIERLP